MKPFQLTLLAVLAPGDVLMGFETQPQLPIIDFGNENLSRGSSSWLPTSHLVRNALESYGCFVAVYRKIPPELHEMIFNLSKELFELPVQIKQQNASDGFGFGYGANFPNMPLIEYLGITNGATVEGIKDFTNLMWPCGNDDFSETAFSYSMLQSEFSDLVMKMVLGSYGIEKYYDTLLESRFHLMRFIKYRTPTMNEINTGLQPHVDKTFLGIIATNHVEGLEIETRNGEWISFQPSPSAFLVLSGEAFTAWSNGKVYAPLHRVIMGGAEEKYTIALFSFMRETLQVPEELVDKENPLQYKPFNNLEFLDYCGQKRIVRGAIKDFCGI